MATKTEIKTASQKEELLKKAHDGIEIFRNYIERGDFAIELDDMTIAIRTNAVKAYLGRNRLFMIYGDIDIKYNSEKTQILLFNKTNFTTTRHDAHELHDIMTELYELSLEKVKEKLEKALKEL